MVVYNKYHNNVPKNAVNIMRPSKWGNPFIIGKDGNREEVVEKFIIYLINNKKLLSQVQELRGKDLVCCCAPKLCHGHVLEYFANGDL